MMVTRVIVIGTDKWKDWGY